MFKIKNVFVLVAATAAAFAIPTAASAYTVQPGDTLGGIAAKHGTTVEQLAAANGISNPNVINVGQYIEVAGSAVTAQADAQAPTVQAPAPVTSGNSAKNEIAQRESGGNYNAVNPSSGATGKYQCLPSAHGYCPTDPAAQEAWADNYVAERYGSWDAALAHHNANGWY